MVTYSFKKRKRQEKAGNFDPFCKRQANLISSMFCFLFLSMGVCQSKSSTTAASQPTQPPVVRDTSAQDDLRQKAEKFWNEIKDLKVPDVTAGKPDSIRRHLAPVVQRMDSEG